jgi:hypothetical protein
MGLAKASAMASAREPMSARDLATEDPAEQGFETAFASGSV